MVALPRRVASAAFSPPLMSAAIQPSPLLLTKSLPSSEAPQVFSSNVTGGGFEGDCMPRPGRPRPQPVAQAAGPKLAQGIPAGRIMCSSVRCVPPDLVGASMTFTQLTPPPNSHVVEND